jgi:hypothetical protein
MFANVITMASSGCSSFPYQMGKKKPIALLYMVISILQQKN